MQTLWLGIGHGEVEPGIDAGALGGNDNAAKPANTTRAKIDERSNAFMGKALLFSKLWWFALGASALSGLSIQIDEQISNEILRFPKRLEAPQPGFYDEPGGALTQLCCGTISGADKHLINYYISVTWALVTRLRIGWSRPLGSRSAGVRLAYEGIRNSNSKIHGRAKQKQKIGR